MRVYSCPIAVGIYAYAIPGYIIESLVKTYQHIYLCVTNPALYNDKLINRCAARSGSPHDDIKIITLASIYAYACILLVKISWCIAILFHIAGEKPEWTNRQNKLKLSLHHSCHQHGLFCQHAFSSGTWNCLYRSVFMQAVQLLLSVHVLDVV